MKTSDINIRESISMGLLLEQKKYKGKRVVITHNLNDRINDHTKKCDPSKMMDELIAETYKELSEKKKKKRKITKPIKHKVTINEEEGDGKRIKYASIKAIELGDFLLIAENKDIVETYL